MATHLPFHARHAVALEEVFVMTGALESYLGSFGARTSALGAGRS